MGIVIGLGLAFIIFLGFIGAFKPPGSKQDSYDGFFASRKSK